MKCGTKVLYPGVWGIGAPRLMTRFGHIARQVVAAEAKGTSIVLISSGAIRAGQENFRGTPSIFRLGREEEWAGIGTRYLLKRWGDAFEELGKEIAYILVSRADFGSQEKVRAITSSIVDYQRCGVVPIINENDVVFDSRHGRSENDYLAIGIAELIGADMILFLTEVGGVYEKNPAHHPGARQYAAIDARTALTNPWLTGGMGIKMVGAVWCFARGMRVAIAGAEGNTIDKFAGSEPVGTMIGTSVRFY